MSALFRVLRGLVLVWVLASLGACESTKRYMRGPREVIRGVPAQIVRNTAIDVLTDHGFRLTSGIDDVMVFEKPGTRNDELMYGWFDTPNATTQRLKIFIELGDEPNTLNLVGEGMIVREIGRMQGEETGYLYAGGRTRYGKLLREIKRKAEAQRDELGD